MNNQLINNFSKWLNLMGIPHSRVNLNFTVGVNERQIHIRPTFKFSTIGDKYMLLIQDDQEVEDIFYDEFKNSFGSLYVIKYSDISHIMQNAKNEEFKKYLEL